MTKVVRRQSNAEYHKETYNCLFAKYVSRALREVPCCCVGNVREESEVTLLGIPTNELPNGHNIECNKWKRINKEERVFDICIILKQWGAVH